MKGLNDYYKNNSKTKKIKKSFSPSINKKIDVKSINSNTIKSVKLCNNNLLSLLINKDNDITCKSYKDKDTINYLLNNLKSSKKLNVSEFIAPKQLLANCWFNTMFVTFFFSDKGRKFFRFFRNLMITGKKYDKTKIENEKIRKLLFKLNLFIEASYNQKNTDLYSQINKLTNNLNTNFFIKEIYDEINDKNLENSIPNIKDAGNPIMYYKTIMTYLNYDVLKILNINITSKLNIYKLITYKFQNNIYISDIIIIEDFESKSIYKLEYKINYKFIFEVLINRLVDLFIINNIIFMSEPSGGERKPT